MSFLFQAGSTRVDDREHATRHAAPRAAPRDPLSVVRSALEALLLGDGSRLESIFTDDVRFRSPHVIAGSRAELLRSACSPESVFGEVEITLDHVVMEDSTMAVEWRVDARLVSPVLFGDNVLIEPTDDGLHLRGSSFAEFSGDRIEALRCYFDDSEMFDGVPGVTQPLRFVARWSGSPSQR